MIMPDLPDYVKDSTFMDITMQWGEDISKLEFFFHAAVFLWHFPKVLQDLLFEVNIINIFTGSPCWNRQHHSKAYILQKIWSQWFFFQNDFFLWYGHDNYWPSMLWRLIKASAHILAHWLNVRFIQQSVLLTKYSQKCDQL